MSISQNANSRKEMPMINGCEYKYLLQDTNHIATFTATPNQDWQNNNALSTAESKDRPKLCVYGTYAL